MSEGSCLSQSVNRGQRATSVSLPFACLLFLWPVLEPAVDLILGAGNCLVACAEAGVGVGHIT